MDLILWRHAEAEPEGDGTDDLARSLTTKGERHAQRMAEWLNRRLADSTRVLISPAVRCQQTAKALGRSSSTVADLAPDLGPELLLKAAQWPDASKPVLVVGHQPTLGLAASLALTGLRQPWSMKKSGVWWIRSRSREEDGQAIVLAVQSPDFL